MDNIIVTAANSFIGRNLCRKLSEKGYFVYAVVRRNCRNLEEIISIANLKIIYADMNEYGKLPKMLAGVHCVGIFMLAWEGTRGRYREDMALQKNNWRNSILSAESALKLGVDFFVTAGSQAEYGRGTCCGKVDENEVCRPDTEYGKYKLQFFEELNAMAEGKRVIEPRFFSLYGPDDSEETMIITIIDKMLLGQSCFMTKCEQVWDYLYIDDAIKGLVALMENPAAQGIYNFGYGESHELVWFVEKMKMLTKSKSDIIYGAIDYPDKGMINVNPSVQKLMYSVGWKPDTNFESGIKNVIKYRKKVLGISEKDV